MIQTCCAADTHELAWWALFQALIPDMGARSIESLKAEYCPCKSLKTSKVSSTEYSGLDYPTPVNITDFRSLNSHIRSQRQSRDIQGPMGMTQ